MPTPKPFLPHGGSYKNLLVYQKSECIYDVTFYFVTIQRKGMAGYQASNKA